MSRLDTRRLGDAQSKGATVLVIEDDAEIGEALREALTEAGYAVQWATDGAEALKLLYALPELPDLILLDLCLPCMDGWQFRTWQLHDAHLAQIPVVAMSAQAPELAQCGLPGPKDFLPKPLSLDTLLRTVAEHAHATQAS